jgi:hypothetical protein
VHECDVGGDFLLDYYKNTDPNNIYQLTVLFDEEEEIAKSYNVRYRNYREMMENYFWTIYLPNLSDNCKSGRVTEGCLEEIEMNKKKFSLENIIVYFGAKDLPQSGLTLGNHILIRKSRDDFHLWNERDFSLLAHEIYHVIQARAHKDSIGDWICGYLKDCIRFDIDGIPFKEDIRCGIEQSAYRFENYVYVDLMMDGDGIPNCKLEKNFYYLFGDCKESQMIGCDSPIKKARDSLKDCLEDLFRCRWDSLVIPAVCDENINSYDFCKYCRKLIDLCPFTGASDYNAVKSSLLDQDGDYKGDYCDKCPNINLSPMMDIDDDCVPDLSNLQVKKNNDEVININQDNCRCDLESVIQGDTIVNLDAAYNRLKECVYESHYSPVFSKLYNPLIEKDGRVLQSDMDGDGLGDKCDPDADGDGIAKPNDFNDREPVVTLDLDYDSKIDFCNNIGITYICDNGKLTYNKYKDGAAPFTEDNSICLTFVNEKNLDKCPRFGNPATPNITNYFANFVKDIVGNHLIDCENINPSDYKWKRYLPDFLWKPSSAQYGAVIKDNFYRQIYKEYFFSYNRDSDGNGIDDNCDTNVFIKPFIGQRTFFPTRNGMIYLSIAALDVAGEIYSTGFTYSGYDRTFSNPDDIIAYQRIPKDNIDITIGACPCDRNDPEWCIKNQCKRPDEKDKPVYIINDNEWHLEYSYKSFYRNENYVGIRYYNPLYTSGITYNPIQQKTDMCISIKDVNYKYDGNNSSKKFCIRKDYIAGKTESKVFYKQDDNRQYNINIGYPHSDYKEGWDFRDVNQLKEEWVKNNNIYYSKTSQNPNKLPYEKNPVTGLQTYTQFRIGWREKYNHGDLSGATPPNGVYTYNTYSDWQALSWRSPSIFANSVPAEDDKICRGSNCSPVNEKMNEIEVRFGGCNPVGSYFYLVDAGVEGRFGVLRNPLENSVKMVFKSENNLFPSGLRDYTQIIEVGTLKELGFGDDERERGIIFIYGGIDGNGDVHNDLYVGYENGTDENMMKKIRWVKIENNGDITPPYAVRPYLFYDRENKQLVVGDGTGKSNEWVTYIYRYNFDGGYWDKTDWNIPPEFYEVIGDNYSLNTAMAHDKRYNVVWGFGGVGRDGVMGWIWRVDLRTYRIEAYPEWMYRVEGEDGAVTNGPGARERMAIYYDGYGSKVYLLGGRDKDGNLHNDIWSFDIDSKKWERISGDSDNLDRVMDGVLVFDRYKNVLSHTRGVRIDGTVSPLVHFDIFNKKWIKLNLNQNYFVTDNEIISGDYNPYNPPVMKYVPSGAIPLKTGLKSVKMVNSTEGLNLLVTDRRNNLLGRGLRMSPEEYVVLAVDKDEDYNLDVVTTGKYSDELVHSYEIDIKDGVIGDKYWEYKYGGIRDVKVRDGYAYIVGMNGLRVVDIKNKREVYKDKELVMSEGIEIRGNRAYIAQGVFGVAVLDVSNPERVEVIGREFLIGYSRDIKVDGDFAYVSTGVFGVQVVDISNDREPRWIGNIWVKDVVMETEVYNRNVVVNGVIKGVRVVDMNGNELAKIRRDKADEMRLYGGKVHIRDKEVWEVYDIRDIGSVVKLGEYSNSESVLRYEYTGKYGVLKTNKGIEISEVVRR